MIKIIISEEMRKAHLKYYHDKVLPEIKKELSKELKKNKINTLKVKLLRYCIVKWEVLAIGSPHKLRRVMKHIRSKGWDRCLRNKQYAKYLHEKVFSYEKFTSINLNYYDLIVDRAKEISNQRNYCPKVVSKIMEVIEKDFPGLLDVAEREIKPIIKANPQIGRKDLENEFKRIKAFPTITLSNYYKYRMWEKKWNPYKLVYMTGLRTCPYCNRQYITPIFRDDGMMRADLDHFFAKSDFPYLSMSLYNLVPACRFCNSSLKGNKEFDIDNINPYEESLDKYMFFDVEIGSKQVNIDIKARENVRDKKIKRTIDKYNEIFKLDSMYEYHKNIAEDMGKKIKYYNKDKISAIKKKLGDFVSDENQIREIIVGKMPNEKQILDEPLNKLKRDILEKYKYFE